MKSWAEVNKALSDIQKSTQKDFKTEISDATMFTVVEGLIDARLSDELSKAFGALSLSDLLIAKEILATDKKTRLRALGEVKRGLN